MEDANIYETRNLYNGMYSSQILNTSGKQHNIFIIQFFYKDDSNKSTFTKLP